MAHEVESMLYAGEAPWHRIGDAISPEQSRDIEFLRHHPAIAWTCHTEPLFLADGREASTRAVVRSTDARVLGEVGADYQIVQNETLVDFVAPFVESGEASVECAGSLREGSRVFLLARINRDPLTVAAGDEVCAYLLAANAHDGSMRLHVGFTPIRVVCANTLAMARSDTRSKLVQLRHTPGIHLALETVRDTIDLANRTFVATVEQYRYLARVACTDETLRKFVSVVFTADVVPETAIVVASDEALPETRSRVFPNVLRLFQEGRGANLSRGTLWGAVNAIAEYTQYERGTDEARRLNETFWGAGAALNRRALEVALRMAA